MDDVVLTSARGSTVQAVCLHCGGQMPQVSSRERFCSEKCRKDRERACDRVRKARAKIGEWNGATARQMAISQKCPVVTPVTDGIWVMYPPREGELVRGGYPAKTPHDALAATEHIARRVWGVSPIVVSLEISKPKQVLGKEGESVEH